MAASLINLLDDLEVRLERTQSELCILREENQRLKQQLALENEQQKSPPSDNTPSMGELQNDVVEHEALESEVANYAAVENHGAVESYGAVEKGELEREALEKNAPESEASITPPSVSPSSQPTNEAPGAPSPHALLNQWYARYPKAFFKGHTKPLKIGIHQDLAEREQWSNKLIRRALANYVNLPRYIKAVRAGVDRVDLDGQPAGKVDKEAAQHASEKRGDKKANGTREKAQAKPAEVTKKPREKAVKPPKVEEAIEKSEPRKALSMEDKLLGLQQKFKGR